MRNKTVLLAAFLIGLASSVFSQQKQLDTFVLDKQGQKVKVTLNYTPPSETNELGGNFIFQETSLDERFMVTQPVTGLIPDVAVSQILDVFSQSKRPGDIMINAKPRSPIILGVKLNPKLKDYFSADVRSFTKSYASYIISDSSAAIVIAMGITTENVKDYQFHVVEDDSIELVPWSPVRDLQQLYGATRPYAFLGSYKAPGHQVVVEAVNSHHYDIREGVVFDWRVHFKPELTQMTMMEPNNRYFNINYAKLNGGYATRFDPVTGLPLDLHFPLDTIESFRLEFKHHETVPYSIYMLSDINGKKDTTLLEWYRLENYFDVENKYYNKPGKYTLVVQRCGSMGSWKEDQTLQIPFEVLPPPVAGRKISESVVLAYGGGGLAAIALGFTGYYRFNKQRLRKAAQQKQAVSLQLRSIRSQLNPHFMFNALGSIQGLMNNNDLPGANHYLSKFADLTRQVLQTGERDMISLEEELKLSANYLEMEQLRFGFKYAIHMDSDIQGSNTEVPPMLLQPFLENAVKHGVATLREHGMIRLSVQRQEKTLVFTVTDNGKGFDKGRSADQGFGLKLSGQRITLLNQEYPGQPAALTIDSAPGNTTVTLKMENWI